MKKTRLIFSSFLVISFSFLLVLTCCYNDSKPEKLDVLNLKEWSIAIKKDAIPNEKYAAKEFQHLYKEATGIELPIQTIKKRPSGKKIIFLGYTKNLEELANGSDTISFGKEDLSINIQKKHIVITGGQPRGTLYGVYTFFEKYMGVRFLTSDYTFFPKVKEQLISVPEKFTYHPPLQFRLSYYGETLRNPAFAVRIKNNKELSGKEMEGLDINTKRGRVNHSFFHQLPAKVGKKHPEYFALHNGLRKIETGCPSSSTQPCLSNPDVIKIMTKSVFDELDKNPGQNFVNLAQNDNDNYCECPNCKAVDEKEGAHSGSVIKFVNTVADNVAEKYPDVTVGTFAYRYSRTPPKHVRPHKNVMIQLCSIECSQIFSLTDSRSELNKKFVKDFEGWSKIADNINIWTYNTNFCNYLIPCPNLWNIEPNINFFVKNHVKGIFMQGAGNATGGDFSDLRNYMTSNLLWNPTLSGEKLMDEFLTLYYQSAAPPIKEWLVELKQGALKVGIKADKNCYATPGQYGITPEIAQDGLKAFQKAMKLADNEEIRKRVEKASITAYCSALGDLFFFSGILQLLHDEWEQGKWKPIKCIAPENIEKVRLNMHKLVELCEKYNITRWSEAWPMDDALQVIRFACNMKKDEVF